MGKIQAKNQWDTKYLRESVFMPFGSMCNLIGQAFQGKGITDEEFEKLTVKAFDLAMEFVKDAFERVEENSVEKEPDIPF